MKNMRSWLISLFGVIFLMLSSCELIQMKEDLSPDDELPDPIARAGDQFLYPDDLEGIATASGSKEDSTERTKRCINSWVRKQILIQEAATKIEFDEAEIERKILDYKFSLMGYEYQSFYINQNLNKQVSDEEIAQYYELNIDNFVLKQNIVRGRFVKLPIGAPKIEKVKALISSKNQENLEELNSYALSFAATYQLNDAVWMVVDEVIKYSPLAEIPNKIQFLQRNKYMETEDAQFKYFLKVEEYRISDNVSPLEFVREDIKNIIINKRKVQLAQKLEEDLYEKAKTNKEFELFN